MLRMIVVVDTHDINNCMAKMGCNLLIATYAVEEHKNWGECYPQNCNENKKTKTRKNPVQNKKQKMEMPMGGFRITLKKWGCSAPHTSQVGVPTLACRLCTRFTYEFLTGNEYECLHERGLYVHTGHLTSTLNLWNIHYDCWKSNLV